MAAIPAGGASSSPLTWSALAASAPPGHQDRSRGPASAQALLRLFDGTPESAARVVLYRDHHAWCPYCQKVWLWLEARRVPYTIRKVTMRCYGDKERWFTAKVPSGMLPALELDGALITESDEILLALERAFGPLPGSPALSSATVAPLRALERRLFAAWCGWLCYPLAPAAAARAEAQFHAVAGSVAQALTAQGGPLFLGQTLTVADVIFIPYLERMVASLFYYKGLDLRARYAPIGAFFTALEALPTYAPLASDFHTHAHDLPPQMGGCYASGSPEQQAAARHVDEGPWATLPETSLPEPPGAAAEAVARVCAHWAPLLRANPIPLAEGQLDAALRIVLSRLATGSPTAGGELPRGCAPALRYIKDRISVPRDMSTWAARRLRQALQDAACQDDERTRGAGVGGSVPLLTAHRRDADPARFAS